MDLFYSQRGSFSFDTLALLKKLTIIFYITYFATSSVPKKMRVGAFLKENMV